jgi:hypothetical protein
MREKKSRPENQWWYREHLIAGLDATPTRKYLLCLVHLHTHARKGFAWASQKTLAREMGTDDSTVERVFEWAKLIGIVSVRRIRTGKGKAEQYNEYWLNIERLKELQRPLEQPAPMQGANDEQPAPVTGASPGSNPHLTPEQPASSTGSNPHLVPPATRTHAGEGFEVKQVASTASSKRAGGNSLRSQPPLPPVRSSLQSELQKLIEQTKGNLRAYLLESEDQRQPLLEAIWEEFRTGANALGLPFPEMTRLYKNLLESVTAPAPVPTPEPVPVSNVANADKPTLWKRSRAFWKYAGRFGWTGTRYGFDPAEIYAYLEATFHVKTPNKLSPEQFLVAWQRLEQGPPKPN